MMRERERAGVAAHVVDDDPAVSIDHELLRPPMQRRFEHGNQREIFGLAAVAVTGRGADLGHVAVRAFQQRADADPAPGSASRSRRTMRATRPADARGISGARAADGSRAPSMLRAPSLSRAAAHAPVRRATARPPPFPASARALRARRSTRPSTSGGSAPAPSCTRWKPVLRNRSWTSARWTNGELSKKTGGVRSARGADCACVREGRRCCGRGARRA